MCDVSQPLGFTDRLNDPVSPITLSQVVQVPMSATVAVQLEGFSLVVAAVSLPPPSNLLIPDVVTIVSSEWNNMMRASFMFLQIAV